MFFTLSKILWFFANPGNIVLLLLVCGALLMLTRWRQAGARLLFLTTALIVFVSTVPVGSWVVTELENRFPAPQSLDRVDGVVVAGGFVNPYLSSKRGGVAIGSAAERLTAMIALANRHPGAKLIFSGGSGDLFRPELKEAPHVKRLLGEIGFDTGRVIFDDRSRNTHENAVNTLRLAAPEPGEVWLLVTSAFHMPRAIGTFRQAGWTIVPYPVDYASGGPFRFSLKFNLLGGFGSLDKAIHEILGLIFYRATGKSDSLFPSPAD